MYREVIETGKKKKKKKRTRLKVVSTNYCYSLDGEDHLSSDFPNVNHQQQASSFQNYPRQDDRSRRSWWFSRHSGKLNYHASFMHVKNKIAY